MTYKILGIHIKPMPQNNEIYVAWQSNLEGYPFCWRCTVDTVTNFPTPATIQEIAGMGSDVHDKTLVKKLFPYLPGNVISH